MSGKRNIKSFGKICSYLKNPEFRSKETGGALLVVDGAEFSGVDFQYVTWRNVKFVNCDFVGAYEIKPESIERAIFEGCRFAGIFNLGKLTHVQFVRCLIDGTSHVAGDTGSADVVFESCELMGNDPEPNHWGSFGAYGEVMFLKCKARWTSLTGETKHVIRECEFEDVDCQVSGDGGGSTILIRDSKLRRRFKMVAASLQSLTIQDCAIDELDLSDATVKGDVLLERVKGGIVNAGVRSVHNFTVNDSQILGPGDARFVMAMDSAEKVVLEKVNFGTGLTATVNLGPGRPLKDSEWRQTPINKLAVIRHCTMPVVDASWLETRQLKLEGNSIGSLNLSNGRIGKLELSGNTIARSVDFNNTQTKESKVQPLAKGQAKLDGSNVKAN